MNRRPFAALLVTLSLLFCFACSKNADIPAPTEAPPVKVDKPADEIKEQPKPVVEVDNEPKPLDDFDIQNMQKKMADIYFDFDKHELREDSLSTLRHHVELLKANADIKVLVEGHCDERGTEEYNLGLGERRASRVHQYFLDAGIDANRLKTISYGEMRPVEEGSNESAWSKNRRAHFRLSK